MTQTLARFIPSTCQTHVQFPFLTSFQTISPSPRLCEMFSNAVSCYDVELLPTRPTNQLEGTPYRTFTTSYSVYYQLKSISCDHLLLCKPRVGYTVLTRKHLVWLLIHSKYNYSFYHRPVFLVALTVLHPDNEWCRPIRLVPRGV